VLVIDPSRNAAAAPLMVLGRDVSTQPPLFVDVADPASVAPFSYRTRMNVSSSQARWLAGLLADVAVGMCKGLQPLYVT
jgi:hypothetical protein